MELVKAVVLRGQPFAAWEQPQLGLLGHGHPRRARRITHRLGEVKTLEGIRGGLALGRIEGSLVWVQSEQTARMKGNSSSQGPSGRIVNDQVRRLPGMGAERYETHVRGNQVNGVGSDREDSWRATGHKLNLTESALLRCVFAWIAAVRQGRLQGSCGCDR